MIEPGATGEVTLLVGDGDTAIAYGSGDVPVLATPRVLALAEQAAVAAIGDELDPGQTSVGVHAELHHLKPTQVGAVATARVEVLAVDGHKITFEFQIIEDGEPVAHGTHQRVVVNRDRFLPGA